MGTTLLDELLTVYRFREKGARDVERATDRISRTLAGASRLAAGFGTVLTGALTGVVKIMASHETELATFASKTGQTTAEVTEKYGAEIERIGQRTGVAFADITRGMEKAYSGGVKATEELIHVTDKAAKFQAAGLGDIAEILSSATTVATTFGITTSEAIDRVTASAILGEGDSESYANAWKNASGIASEVGLSSTELGAILSVASQEMKSVTKAGNAFIQFLNLLLRPTDRAREALQDFASVGLDIESIQKRVRAGDFLGVHSDLERLFAANENMMGEVLEGSEAMQAFLAVPFEKVAKREAAIVATSPGAPERAFEQGANTIERQIKRLLNDFKSFILDIGDTMRPTINEMMELARELMEEFRELNPEVKELVGQLLLLGPPLLVLAGLLAFASTILTPFALLLTSIFGAGGIIGAFATGTAATAIGVFLLDLQTAALAFAPIVASLLTVLGISAAIVIYWEKIAAFLEGMIERLGLKKFFPSEEERGGRNILDDALLKWFGQDRGPVGEGAAPIPALGGASAATEAAQSGALLSVPTLGLGAGGAAAGGARTLSFQVGDVMVQTQATDAAGIARDIRGALEAELQSTAEDFDSSIEG